MERTSLSFTSLCCCHVSKDKGRREKEKEKEDLSNIEKDDGKEKKGKKGIRNEEKRH